MRADQIARLLPATYQRAATPGSPLSALLGAMAALHAPSEAVLDAVDDLVAPYRTPDRLVPFLLRWVAWDHLPAPVPTGRLRDLVAAAPRLAALRGTAAGLTGLLTTVCGTAGIRVEEPADRPFHLVVRVPATAARHADLIRRIVAVERPVATTYEVAVEAPVPDPVPDPVAEKE